MLGHEGLPGAGGGDLVAVEVAQHVGLAPGQGGLQPVGETIGHTMQPPLVWWAPPFDHLDVVEPAQFGSIVRATLAEQTSWSRSHEVPALDIAWPLARTGRSSRPWG